MEKLNTDQVLIWVLIIITLGAVAWAALQNWFIPPKNQYNQAPAYFPPFGAYPPHAGGDYPHIQTPRRSSPVVTLLLVGIAAFGLFKWVSGIKPPTDNAKKTGLAFENPVDLNRGKDEAGVLVSGGSYTKNAIPAKEDTIGKIQPVAYEYPLPATPPVRIETPVATPVTTTPYDQKAVPEAGYSVQVAALENFAGFERLATVLQKRFPRATIFRHISEIAPGVYGDKLLIGRFKTRTAALEGIKKLRALGYKNCFPVDFEQIDMVEVYAVKAE